MKMELQHIALSGSAVQQSGNIFVSVSFLSLSTITTTTTTTTTPVGV
ncbi:MAG: hypothetical protein RSA53_02550 [Odoribacter sp.]